LLISWLQSWFLKWSSFPWPFLLGFVISTTMGDFLNRQAE
jgi:hypothetical protein